ncbi:hypothetical protein [Pontibacter chitinilyticus]|uniref:hypothetical protein n=1 Tax=Pontibacter chitinilyticus TaxID=2674989 RepID=UPI00321B8EA0
MKAENLQSQNLTDATNNNIARTQDELYGKPEPEQYTNNITRHSVYKSLMQSWQHLREMDCSLAEQAHPAL